MKKNTKKLLYLAGGAAVLYYFFAKKSPHVARGAFAVGAGVPPGGDYSFTRAPGFNSKEY